MPGGLRAHYPEATCFRPTLLKPARVHFDTLCARYVINVGRFARNFLDIGVYVRYFFARFVRRFSRIWTLCIDYFTARASPRGRASSGEFGISI